MRIALLTGAAALALAGTAGARAETIYVTEPDTVVAPGYVYSEPSQGYVSQGYVYSEPSYVVRDRAYVVTEPPAMVVVTEPPAMVVAPRRERVVVVPRREREVVVSRREREVVVPRREREVVVEQPASRDSYSYRGTWRGNGGYVSTSYSSGSSCAIDINGFERCY
jgi:hypothetical protein